MPHSFFTGLDVPWMRLTTFSGATAVSGTPLDADLLRDPTASQLGPRVYASANVVLEGARVLQSVLTDNHVLLRQLFEETVMILDGRGSTTVWNDAGQRITFEWKAGALFAIPLNC